MNLPNILMIKISSWVFFRWSIIRQGAEIWYAWHVICKHKTKASGMTMQCSKMESSPTIEIICPVNLWANLPCQDNITETIRNAVVEWREKLTFALKSINVWTTSQWPYWHACIKAVYIQLADHTLRYDILTHVSYLSHTNSIQASQEYWVYLPPVIPKVDLNTGFK